MGMPMYEAFFHSLWKKNEAGFSARGIYLPHTIIFENGQPKAWYFQSIRDDVILKKKAINMTPENIQQAFIRPTRSPLSNALKQIPLTDIVAFIATWDIDDEVEIMHLTLEEFSAFIYSPPLNFSGILQKFVPPPPPERCNREMIITYTRGYTQVTQRANKHHLSDGYLPASFRGATHFHLLEHSHPIPSVSTLAHTMVARACKQVADHITHLGMPDRERFTVVNKMVVLAKLVSQDESKQASAASVPAFGQPSFNSTAAASSKRVALLLPCAIQTGVQQSLEDFAIEEGLIGTPVPVEKLHRKRVGDYLRNFGTEEEQEAVERVDMMASPIPNDEKDGDIEPEMLTQNNVSNEPRDNAEEFIIMEDDSINPDELTEDDDLELLEKAKALEGDSLMSP